MKVIYCHLNQLTSLVGAPKTVGDGFYCCDNHLTSLVGAPETVNGRFDCSNNHLTSLAGIPRTISENFHISEYLKDKFSEKYIRSLSKIAGKVVYYY